MLTYLLITNQSKMVLLTCQICWEKDGIRRHCDQCFICEECYPKYLTTVKPRCLTCFDLLIEPPERRVLNVYPTTLTVDELIGQMMVYYERVYWRWSCLSWFVHPGRMSLTSIQSYVKPIQGKLSLEDLIHILWDQLGDLHRVSIIKYSTRFPIYIRCSTHLAASSAPSVVRVQPNILRLSVADHDIERRIEFSYQAGPASLAVVPG
jgi:hypothetical protein